MVITAEQIEARKGALLKRMDQLRADTNATVGALQDCEYWLAQLHQPESPEVQK